MCYFNSVVLVIRFVVIVGWVTWLSLLLTCLDIVLLLLTLWVVFVITLFVCCLYALPFGFRFVVLWVFCS